MRLVALLLLGGEAVSVENERTVKRMVGFSLGFDDALGHDMGGMISYLFYYFV